MVGATAGDAWRDICTVQAWFPTGRMVVGLLGSRTFHDPCSPSICRYLGEALWNAGVVLFTTKANGIPELVTWSYTYTGGRNAKRNAFHLVSSESKIAGDLIENSYMGFVLAGGKTQRDQEKLFSMITPVYILIEGGPRCAEMARVAMQHGATIIPVARTGGAARGLFDAPYFPKPNGVTLRDWLILRGELWANEQDVAACVVRVLQALYFPTV